MDNQWENIVIPEVYDEQGLRYTGYSGYQHVQNTRHRRSFLLRGLHPATNYEARVQARNDHGWNKLSSIFPFSTAPEGTYINYRHEKNFSFISHPLHN